MSMVGYSLRTRETIMPTSKTQHVIDDITGDIASGRLRPGDQIPSAAELRAKYGYSITVVRAAVNWLKATGVLVGVPGVGVFVKERE